MAVGRPVRLILLFAALVSVLPLSAGSVVAITIDGVVHPVTVEIVGNALDSAGQRNASALLIRLNTPGGLLDATRHITEKIAAAPVPVIAYVAPSGGRAASAGFFLLQAADIAAMAPGTNTGAASPVLLGKEMDPVMRKKAENDAAAAIRSIAAKRGRNAELAQQTVLEAKSFTEEEALKNKLIEVVASSDRQLLDQLDGREVTRFDGRKVVLRTAGAEIVEYEKTIREKVMSALSDPNIAFVLLILGALGIYIEFSSPGLIAPGVGGAILVLLALSALSVLPINWGGAGLILLALVLFALESQFASHGILGVGGAISMVLGALLLVEGPPEVRIRFGTALAVVLPFAAITTFLVSLVVRARANKVMTGEAGMLNEIGVARTPLAPEGKVFVRGEFWDAISTTAVDAGARVRVVAIDGLTLKVEPIE